MLIKFCVRVSGSVQTTRASLPYWLPLCIFDDLPGFVHLQVKGLLLPKESKIFLLLNLIAICFSVVFYRKSGSCFSLLYMAKKRNRMKESIYKNETFNSVCLPYIINRIYTVVEWYREIWFIIYWNNQSIYIVIEIYYMPFCRNNCPWCYWYHNKRWSTRNLQERPFFSHFYFLGSNPNSPTP